MFGAIKRLVYPKERCGACLFMLNPEAKPLKIDVDADLKTLFYTYDTHSVRHADLLESAARGCTTCARFVKGLRQLKVADFITMEWEPRKIASQTRSPLLTDSGEMLELCMPPGDFKDDMPNYLHPAICPGVRLAGHTGDDKALDQVAAWLDKCKRDHEFCGQGMVTFTPTRLLYLARDDPEVIRLIERPQSPVRFAALSHRWSESTKAACLTATNVEQRKSDGIPLSVFPRMMRDVIYVVRRLGIHYIWIDCMCIIQGNKEDWLREAATMADIYSNAQVTIAATWCTSSSQSLFCNKSRDELSTVELPPINGKKVFLRRPSPHFTGRSLENGQRSGRTFNDPETEWPLISRAWVYQEQWLSPRMVHFTQHELIWQCRTLSTCECGLLDDVAVNDVGLFSLDRSGYNPTSENDWGQIVKSYSARAVTVPTDRLPALAGVATEFAKGQRRKDPPCDDYYLCGHWRLSIKHTFFWVLTAPVIRRPSVRLPSWSWASVTGRVDIWSAYMDDDVKFLEDHVRYDGDTYMGKVVDAWLRLSAPMVRGVLYHGHAWVDIVNSSTYEDTTRDFLLSPTEWNKDVYGVKVGDQLMTMSPDYKLDEHGDGFVESGSPISCLVFSQSTSVTRDPEHPEDDEETIGAVCLVLRCVNGGKSVFERLGAIDSLTHSLEYWQTMALSEIRELTLV
jgi:hypothetical protein